MRKVDKNLLFLIEDCGEVLQLMTEIFMRRGFRVLGARNGREALDKLAEVPELPAVLILDIVMPTMNGFTFRQEQEKDPELCEIPVIVLTGDINAEAQATQMGAHAHLQKPCSVQTLIKTAEKFCH